MGLGKTLITLNWIRDFEHSVLVVAPLKGCSTTWPDEIAKWTPEQTFTILHGPDKDYNLKRKRKIYIINYEGLPWLFESLVKIFKAKKPMPFKAMIIDEGSMVKSHSSKRFKVLKQLKDLCTGGIVILSGTPAPTSLENLWSQYFLLDKGLRLGKNITTFLSTYFDRSAYCAFKYTLKSPEHAEIIYKKIEDITFRLEAADYLDLPDQIDNIIKVVIPPSLMLQYKELEKKFFLELEGEKFSAASAATKSMKLRQFVQGGLYNEIEEGVTSRKYKLIHTEKLDALKDLVEEANGQGILCAIQFRFELDMIREVFPNAPIIAGPRPGEPKVDFAKVVASWNRGEIPLLLCHPASLSHSVNMQTGSHLLVWYSLPWSLEHYLQLTKRLHRQGQTQTVISHHLVAKGTVDELIMKALATKALGQNKLLDYLKEASYGYKG